MTEQVNKQRNYQDLHTPKPESLAPGLELAGGESAEVVKNNIAAIQEAITADKPVTLDQVSQLNRALGNISIDADGQKITLKEYKENPDIANTLEVIKEMEAGDFDRGRVSSIRYLDPDLAHRLVKAYPVNEYLALSGITKLSSKTAMALCEFNGGYGASIDLSNLVHTTPEVIKGFQSYQGHLELGLNQLSEEAARALALLKCSVELYHLEEISEECIEILAHSNSILRLNTNMGEVQERIRQLQRENNFK